MKIKVQVAAISSAIIALLAPGSAFAALTVGSTSVVSDGVFNLTGAAGSDVVLGSSTTFGAINIGNASHEGVISIGATTGRSIVYLNSPDVTGTGIAQETYIANGATGIGSTNKIYIGNNDLGDGTTTIKIGDSFKLGGSTTIAIASAGGGTGDTVRIGNTNGVSSLNLFAGTGNVLLQGAVTTTYTIGTTTGTGTITIGRSTASNTISIGSATTGAGNTQTINIGSSATSTGKAVIVIGNATTLNATSVAIRSGKNNGGGILLEGGLNFGTAFDGDDDYDITIAPAPSFPTTPATGMVIIFQVLSANINAATITVNTRGPYALVKGNDAALATNDIIPGRTYIAVFDGSNFDLINPATQ